MSEKPVVLVSLDTQPGVLKRYRLGANGRPIVEESIRIEPWEPVKNGEDFIDPDAIEAFRRASTAFDEPKPPMVA